MIVRIDIEGREGRSWDYRVTHEHEVLYEDVALPSIAEALASAVEGMPPDVVAAEVALRGVISGTYPLPVLAINHEQVAAHALNTTAAVEEATGLAPD
jgi:hypothetical protein